MWIANALLICFFCTVANSATLLVPSEYSTIQSAINASSAGDTILVSPGTYDGPISFLGKGITVRSITMNPIHSIIDSFFWNHCVSFTNGEDSTSILEGFTITNGSLLSERRNDQQESPEYGGGIYIVDSSPTVRNNIITQCGAYNGGGVYCYNSRALIQENIIISNEGYDYGGGVFVDNYGNDACPVFVGNSILSNEAERGAGIYIRTAIWDNSEVLLFNNTISGGTASFGGGGIYASLDAGDKVVYGGNLIEENTAIHDGGGIYHYTGEAIMIGNVLAENTAVAGVGGGVVFEKLDSVSMHNNSISANSASDETHGVGGIYFLECDFVDMMNCIAWDNISVNANIPNVLIYSSYVSIEYCNIGGGLDSIWIDSTSVLDWGVGNISVDPSFEVGPLSDYHLSEGSPCIDSGNPASEYNDPEDPFNPGYAIWPAMGYLRNDMGTYGGQGVGYVLSVEEEEGSPPPGLLLSSYPNPFTASCTITLTVPESCQLTLCVYDLSGRLVRSLFEGVQPAGNYTAWFDGSDLPSGVYVVTLRTSNQMTSHRCVLVR